VVDCECLGVAGACWTVLAGAGVVLLLTVGNRFSVRHYFVYDTLSFDCTTVVKDDKERGLSSLN